MNNAPTKKGTWLIWLDDSERWSMRFDSVLETLENRTETCVSIQHGVLTVTSVVVHRETGEWPKTWPEAVPHFSVGPGVWKRVEFVPQGEASRFAPGYVAPVHPTPVARERGAHG